MDLIKREDAVKALERAVTFEGGKKEMTIREVFADIPSVEPKKGEWVVEDGRVVCSECGEPNHETNFCPNCGTRMK